MDRLAYRDDTGRARLTRYGMQMYCSTQATADCFAKLEESIPRWIPVKDRLPEKRKWVLCFCQANIIDVLRYENAEWHHDPTHVYMFEFVTHWMPLPEPPKEE